MLEHYQSIVEQNQSNLNYFKTKPNITDFDQKIKASYDMAVARMNTVLLKLIQYPLVAVELEADVTSCQITLNKFYLYTKKYDNSKLFKWYYKICLHNIGKKQFPYIMSLMNIVDVKTRN